MVPAAIGVAIVRHRFPARRVSVHDRHVDVITGVMLIMLVVALVLLFTARLGYAASMLRLDFLVSPLWIAAVISILFGMRAVIAQLPSLWVLTALWPFPYIVISSHLPVGVLRWVIVSWTVSLTVAALTRSRMWRKVMLATPGILAGIAWCAVAPVPPLAPVLSAVIVALAARVLRVPWVWRDTTRLPVDRDTLAVPRAWAGIVLLAISFGLALIPAEALVISTTALYRDPGRDCPPISGQLIETTRFGGGPDRVGGDWATRRCTYLVNDGGGLRTIAVDITQPVTVPELGAFPDPAVLEGPGRLDPTVRNRSVLDADASVFIWSDPIAPSELTDIVFYVEAGDDRWRRVRVLVSDDRSGDATYPLPDPKPLEAALSRVGIVFRTQQSQLRTFAVAPKDVRIGMRYAHEVAAGAGSSDERRGPPRLVGRRARDGASRAVGAARAGPATGRRHARARCRRRRHRGARAPCDGDRRDLDRHDRLRGDLGLPLVAVPRRSAPGLDRRRLRRGRAGDPRRRAARLHRAAPRVPGARDHRRPRHRHRRPRLPARQARRAAPPRGRRRRDHRRGRSIGELEALATIELVPERRAPHQAQGVQLRPRHRPG